jgi:hypothetical protein
MESQTIADATIAKTAAAQPWTRKMIKEGFFKTMDVLNEKTYIHLFELIKAKMKDQNPDMSDKYFTETQSQKFEMNYFNFFAENSSRLECILPLIDPNQFPSGFEYTKPLQTQYDFNNPTLKPEIYPIQIWSYVVSHSYLSETEARRQIFDFMKYLDGENISIANDHLHNYLDGDLVTGEIFDTLYKFITINLIPRSNSYVNVHLQ